MIFYFKKYKSEQKNITVSNLINIFRSRRKNSFL